MPPGGADPPLPSLPKTVARSRGLVAVRLLSIPGGGLEKSGLGSLPGMAIATDEHLGRRYADLFLLLQEEQRLISQGILKRRETRSRTGNSVASIFHPHELLTPCGGIGGDEAAKSHLQVLIDSLRLAVRLGMTTRGQTG
jgi:hypothetical protein